MINSSDGDILDLESLSMFIKHVNSVRRKVEKIKIVRKYKHDDFIMSVLKKVYNPYWESNFDFFAMSRHRENEGRSKNKNYTSIHEVMDDFQKDTIDVFGSISEKYRVFRRFIYKKNRFDYYNLVRKIFSKNLEMGLSQNDIKIALGEDFVPSIKYRKITEFNHENRSNRFRPDNDEFFLLQHIDGVRCFLVYDNDGKCNIYGLDSMRYYTLWKIINEAEYDNRVDIQFRNIVLEGTFTHIDENGNSNKKFAYVNKRARHYTMKPVKFMPYDLITRDEFEKGYSSTKYGDRLKKLFDIFSERSKNWKSFDLPKYTKIRSSKELDYSCRIGYDNGFDGFLLMRNNAYNHKTKNDIFEIRHKTDILPIKTFYSRSTHSISYKNTSKLTLETFGQCTPEIIESKTLYAIICKKYNKSQYVICGLTLDEKETILKNKDLLINKQVEVYYLDEYSRFNDEKKLRHMIFSKFVD